MWELYSHVFLPTSILTYPVFWHETDQNHPGTSEQQEVLEHLHDREIAHRDVTLENAQRLRPRPWKRRRHAKCNLGSTWDRRLNTLAKEWAEVYRKFPCTWRRDGVTASDQARSGRTLACTCAKNLACTCAWYLAFTCVWDSKKTNNKQQTTNNKQQTNNNKQQTNNNKQQLTTNNKQQTTNNKQQQTSTTTMTTDDDDDDKDDDHNNNNNNNNNNNRRSDCLTEWLPD